MNTDCLRVGSCSAINPACDATQDTQLLVHDPCLSVKSEVIHYGFKEQYSVTAGDGIPFGPGKIGTRGSVVPAWQ